MTRAEGDRVEVARAKGRPMLSWVGKRSPREVQASDGLPLDVDALASSDDIVRHVDA